MAVPKLLKSTPFLASSGVVGVGGTSVIIWQATGQGASVPENAPTSPLPHSTDSLSISHTSITDTDEEGEDSPSPAKVWNFSPVSTGDFSAPADLFNSFNTSTEVEVVSSEVRLDNNIFKLKTYRCFDQLFGELPSLNQESVWVVSGEEDHTEEMVIPSAPTTDSAGNLIGCSVMQLHQKDRNFLFKSEIVARNDNFGMVLWTGMKGSIPTNSDSFTLKLIHYLMFIEKTENDWSFKGGYSWGGKHKPITVKSLTVTSPGNSINVTFSKDQVNGSGEKNYSYSGVWESSSDSSGNEILGFEDKDYDSGQGTPFTFELPFKVKGYQNTINSFLKPSETNNRNWEWKKNNGDNSKSSEIASSISSWYEKLMKDKKGSWKSMSDYCSGKKDLEESQRKESVCFLEGVQSNDT